jgi:hypothetical protein
MSFQSKDGKSFGSKFVAKRRDTEHAKMAGEGDKAFGQPAKGSVPKEESRTDSMGETNKTAYPGVEQVDNTADTKASPEGVDPSAVAAEHGGATHITVHHDHKNNKHHVVSHHPSGHMHTSDHASAPDAHAAAAQLSGEQHTENNDKPANADQSGDSTMDMFNDGFKTPKLP